jgi:hypothetical protein
MKHTTITLLTMMALLTAFALPSTTVAATSVGSVGTVTAPSVGSYNWPSVGTTNRVPTWNNTGPAARGDAGAARVFVGRRSS